MPPAPRHYAPSHAISPRDGMLSIDRADEYFWLGRRALDLLLRAGRLCDKPHFGRILDLPCGHGRVLRWLKVAFGDAAITACDLDRDGVDFCREQFGVEGVYSHEDLRQVSFPAPFDLIWCGSLLTHLPPAQWPEILDLFEQWTAECGMIVVSLQGRFCATALARGKTEIAQDLDRDALLQRFRAEGTAFERYRGAEGDYGLTLTTPEAFGRLVQSRPNLILRGYFEQAWGVQDIAVLYKKTGFNQPWLTRTGFSPAQTERTETERQKEECDLAAMNAESTKKEPTT